MSPEAVLQKISSSWLRLIAKSREHKRKEFGNTAEECMKFFDGPYHDWLYSDKQFGTVTSGGGDEDKLLPPPAYKVTINKAAELVQLFGPALYQRNPDRKVTPRRAYAPPPEYYGVDVDPANAQAYEQILRMANERRAKDLVRAQLFEQYLNYTPAELDLRQHSRMWVTEALLKGMGVLWTEFVTMPSGHRVVGSFSDSVDNLFADPDATSFDDCMWFARQCTHPKWQVERDYGLKPGSLKTANGTQSATGSAWPDPNDNSNRAQSRRNETSDVLTYFKIYSRMGIGARIKSNAVPDDLNDADSMLGDYCYLAVAPGLRYPLNLTPDTFASGDIEMLRKAVEWPIPFWLDGRWPFVPLWFHRVPGRLWPISHLKPALGELRLINWLYSLMTGKVRVNSRDILVLNKGLSEESKQAILHGPDYSVVEIDGVTQKASDLASFIQHPNMNQNAEMLLDRTMVYFEQRTGLSELLYGATQTQLRSATEANVKNNNASVRPDDMAQTVEEQAGVVATNELIAARWMLEPDDVRPALGDVGAYLWQAEVLTSDVVSTFHQYECNVESGSARRPNRDRDVANMNQSMQTLFQPLMQLAMAGNPAPVNALIADWGKANGFDPSKYLISPPPPPMPATPTDQPAEPQTAG